MICGHCKARNVTREHVLSHRGVTDRPNDNLPAAVFERHPVTEAGMYRHGETIFKVQKAVHGSGHLYAKRLVPGEWQEVAGERLVSPATFEYAPGALKTLAAEDRLTVEQAKEYGALYGTCIVCGRTLTDEKSIAAGIGPVCAGKV